MKAKITKIGTIEETPIGPQPKGWEFDGEWNPEVSGISIDTEVTYGGYTVKELSDIAVGAGFSILDAGVSCHHTSKPKYVFKIEKPGHPEDSIRINDDSESLLPIICAILDYFKLTFHGVEWRDRPISFPSESLKEYADYKISVLPEMVGNARYLIERKK